jgi:hypothetical protein
MLFFREISNEIFEVRKLKVGIDLYRAFQNIGDIKLQKLQLVTKDKYKSLPNRRIRQNPNSPEVPNYFRVT